MNEIKILWADDEIEHLKAHLFFLEEKGFDVTTVTNGLDAIDKVKTEHYDLVFLDENMPGISGLETLKQIKEIDSNVPVVMITKSEEEHIMEDAIGSKIADYLIKPVNPRQILSTIKKLTDNKRLVTESVTQRYQQDFRNIGMAFMDYLDWPKWKELYKKLTYWEIEMDGSNETGMEEILGTQKADGNREFSKYIEKNYIDFIAFEKDIPTRKATDEILKKADVEVSIVMEFDNVETVKRGLEINAGVAIIPKNTVANETARNQLVTCRLDNSTHLRPLSLIHKKSRMLTPALRSFIEKMQNTKINDLKKQTDD